MKLNIVPARTGLEWVRLGIRTFARQPFALTVLFFMYTSLVVGLAAIPLVGPMLVLLLIPAGTLGLMAATQQAAAGKTPTPLIFAMAFRAGRQRARAMLTLGGIYVAAGLVFALLAYLLLPLPAATEGPPTTEQQREMARAYLIAAFFQIPISLAFWHAPALVHWHDVSPAKSLFFSFVAWVRNFRALLVYAAAWTAVFIFAAVIAGAVATLVPGEMAQFLAAPIVLIAAAMFFTSLFFTFRDSFVADNPEPEQPPPGESP